MLYQTDLIRNLAAERFDVGRFDLRQVRIGRIEKLTGLDFKGLRAANGGGMAVQRAVAERFIKLTGCPIIEGYGLSETSPVLTCNPAGSTEYTGTIGLPVPSTEISIRDEEGREVPLGEPGDIVRWMSIRYGVRAKRNGPGSGVSGGKTRLASAHSSTSTS